MVSPARSPNHCRAKTNKMLTDSTQSTALVKGESPDYIESSPLTPASQLFKWCLKRSEKHEKLTKVAYTKVLLGRGIPRFCHSRCGIYTDLPSPYAGIPSIHRLDREVGDKLAKLLSHFLSLLCHLFRPGLTLRCPAEKLAQTVSRYTTHDGSKSESTEHCVLARKAVR